MQWILWSRTTQTAILVSPEEAEVLIPLCRKAPTQIVHLLTYAAPITQRMLQFNDLNYYAIPPLPVNWCAPTWLKVQVGIFAGRLYFPFEELEHIRSFLGLQEDQLTDLQKELIPELDDPHLETSGGSSDDEQQQQPSEEADGSPEVQQARASMIKATRMLTFLHAWLGTRSRGQDFTHTPMGYICARKLLTEDHPFFRNLDIDEMVARSRFVNAGGGGDADAPYAAGAAVDGDEDDNASDADEDDVDERQKLTAEELRRSEEDETDGEEDDFTIGEEKDVVQEDQEGLTTE